MLNKPEVVDGLGWYLEAFWDLTSDRQLGAMGGAGSIPFTAIDRYAARHDIDEPAAFDRLRVIMRALDAEYLKWLGEKQKKPEKAPKRAGKR